MRPEIILETKVMTDGECLGQGSPGRLRAYARLSSRIEPSTCVFQLWRGCERMSVELEEREIDMLMEALGNIGACIARRDARSAAMREKRRQKRAA
jgi:hypothetical protein